jgi:hypothetical protein
LAVVPVTGADAILGRLACASKTSQLIAQFAMGDGQALGSRRNANSEWGRCG